MTKATILLVDDEAAIRYLIAETLEEEGFAIVEAEDGISALHLIESTEFDLILLDYMMPGMTGIEVCEWLRGSENTNRNKPVLLLSAKATDNDKRTAREAGISEYIYKPFSPIQLVETVNQHLLRKGEEES